MAQFYLIGGAVRDLVMGLKPNDYDYVVQCSGFEELILLAKAAGFLPVPNSNSASGFVEEPDHLGIKALCPDLKTVVDIHCARKEYFYSDGAHPDIVQVGTYEEDGDRRDFTCNQLRLPRGVYDVNQIIDRYKGLDDIRYGLLHCVGDDIDRLTENPDRVIRAFRFASTYNWEFSVRLEAALRDKRVIERVRKENDDRKVKSLNKIFKNKQLYHKFFEFMARYSEMSEAIFSNVGIESSNKKAFQ